MLNQQLIPMTQASVHRRLSVSKIRSTVGIGASKHRAREGPSGPLPRLAGKARGSPVSPTRQLGTDSFVVTS